MTAASGIPQYHFAKEELGGLCRFLSWVCRGSVYCAKYFGAEMVLGEYRLPQLWLSPLRRVTL